MIGTPAYMSPEQLLRHPTDARSDQYSFCVALWEAIHGLRPFAGGGVRELAAAIERAEIERHPAYTWQILSRIEAFRDFA